jgi:hypothetical protein
MELKGENRTAAEGFLIAAPGVNGDATGETPRKSNFPA